MLVNSVSCFCKTVHLSFSRLFPSTPHSHRHDDSSFHLSPGQALSEEALKLGDSSIRLCLPPKTHLELIRRTASWRQSTTRIFVFVRCKFGRSAADTRAVFPPLPFPHTWNGQARLAAPQQLHPPGHTTPDDLFLHLPSAVGGFGTSNLYLTTSGTPIRHMHSSNRPAIPIDTASQPTEEGRKRAHWESPFQFQRSRLLTPITHGAVVALFVSSRTTKRNQWLGLLHAQEGGTASPYTYSQQHSHTYVALPGRATQ